MALRSFRRVFLSHKLTNVFLVLEGIYTHLKKEKRAGEYLP
jgi:hypothetical protein